MTYRLSLIDKSPLPAGSSAAEAFRATLRMAQRAEALGYHRFWVAEHHGNPNLAGSAPEVLAAYLLAQTQRIRIGSGGVMLQHYSPYKVAEVFKVLSALAPGRVDLGVGKAPGGLPQSTRALQARHDPAHPVGFDSLLGDLDAFLHTPLPPGHPLEGAWAGPVPSALPECVLLGAAPDSARLAARLGWHFCYAGHFNSDPAQLERSLAAYRQDSGREPWMALYAFAAPRRAQAERLVAGVRTFKLHLPTGQSVNLPSPEAAAEFARQAGVHDYRLEETRPQVIAGTAEEVRTALDQLHQRHGITEFVIDTPVPDFDERLASIGLLAQARQPCAEPALA
ncbi:MAG: LLM class flavin-dependent oxidoreductase [Burkholderiaceae bacterium]|nr:LLM class flavin-dependent oxidoreductase [Burkholderiaceae bacterium]